MAKRQGGKKRGAKAGKPSAGLPPMLMMEQVMRGMFGAGAGPGNAAAEAQDLTFAAMDALSQGRAREAVAGIREALRLDPQCVDALTLLAQLTSQTDEEIIPKMEEVVAIGEEALGKRFFAENKGNFWGLMETRPYMRARQFLANRLADTGRLDEAIGHFEAMLELNPGDNQGIRYGLLGHYLRLGRHEAAQRLLGQYDDEGSAMFAWGRVLERFLAGELVQAGKRLAEARKVNRHVEGYLTGRKKMPSVLPEFYGIGDSREAIVCMTEIGPAWQAHPAAVDWLKQQKRGTTA